MTHNNVESAAAEREIIGWLEVLNWRPDRPDAELRTWLPQAKGPSADRAVLRLDDADRLRRLVDALIKAEYHLGRIRLTAEDAKLVNQHLTRPMEAFWGLGKAGLLVLARCEDTSARPFNVAVAVFLRIAARRDRWRFNSPCLSLSCGQYFLRKRRRLTKYHRGCRRSESSPRMKAERKRKHDHLLALARKGIEEYQRYRGRENWKTWVCRYIRQKDDTVITPKSLTRWVNDGKRRPSSGLTPPKGTPPPSALARRQS